MIHRCRFDLVVFGCAQCTVTNPPGTVPGTFRVDGNPLRQAPKYVANVTARCGWPTGRGGEYFACTDWSYRRKVNFFLCESPEFAGRAMLLGGLRRGYNWSDGKHEFALFAPNITNQARSVGGIDFNNPNGYVRRFPGGFGPAWGGSALGPPRPIRGRGISRAPRARTAR